MPIQEGMPVEERLKYLRIMLPHYQSAGRKGRSKLLDDMERATGLQRKTIIRRMNGIMVRKSRTRQRGRVYGSKVEDAIKIIAEGEDYITAEQLVMHGELKASPHLLEQLQLISTSTVARILKKVRHDQPRLPQKGPVQANRCTKGVPMCRIPWNEPELGHFELDLVHHAGRSSSGDYVHTLQMADVATGWSERVALPGRSFLVMRDAFQRILARLPFPILELHPDNGPEFFIDHLLRFGSQSIQGLHLSRSRPWYQHDNRSIEQKNDSLVRAYLGHERLDTANQTNALNMLYDQMWLYYNFFQPVMRMVENRNGSPVRHGNSDKSASIAASVL